MNPVPMSENTICRFSWGLVAAAILLVVPLALQAQSEDLAAPLNLAATSSDSEVTLSWTDPIDSDITKYQISIDGGSNFINVECGNSTAIGYTVTGLTNGTPYTFQVRAYDDSGPGASETVTATPLLPAPTELVAWPGDKYIQLRWKESQDSRISGYQVSVDGGASYSWVRDQGHESETFGYSANDLTNGTNYTIKVRAVNGKAATFNTEDTTPLIPALSSLRATPGYGRVTLSWRDPNESDIGKYQFSSDDGNSYTSVAYNSTDLTYYSDADNREFIKYTIDGLTNDTSYTFKVRTADAEGTVIGAVAPVEAEGSLTATPLFAAPSNLTAAPGAGQVTLSWDDPETTEISKYQLKIDSDPFADIPSSGATTTSHTVDNLTNYTSYTFEVRAYDSNAAGASAAVIAYPVAGPTAPPDNLRATPADSQMTLTWDDPGNAAITGYEVSSDGGVSYSTISSSSATTTSHTVLNLTNWTKYRFTVRAVNASGVGAPSKAVGEEPGVVPLAVVDLTATPKHERVELSWDDPDPNDVDNRTSLYKVRYKKTNDNAWGKWVDIRASSKTTIDELENATSYDFAVRAHNYIGDGAISELTTSPVATAPLAPTNLVAARGDGEVTLTWTDTRDDEVITKYHISSDGGTSYTGISASVIDSGTTTVSYIVRRLTNGTEYTFMVKAENSAGTGPPSDPGVTGTPLFAAPKGLQASPGGGQVTLTWDNPVIPPNNTLTGYELSSDGGEFAAMSGSGATTTEHTVTGLDGGTEQRFAVRAVNGLASTARETPLFASPADLTAMVGDQQITLNWTDPGISAISGYEVSSDNGANYTPIINSMATTTTHIVDNLSNGTEYSFAVRAVNCPANGAAALATATPLFDAPTGLTPTAGYGEVTLGWDNPGNSNISGYEVSSDGGTVYNSITGSMATTTSHTVLSLTGGTSYTFAVRAINGAPEMVNATPLFAPPTNLSATAGYGEVTLGWDNPGNSNISGYEVSSDAGAFAEIGGSDASTTGHIVGSLIGGTSYTFAVRAINGAPEMVNATPLFAPPTNLSATAGYGEVTLSWDNPENTKITGYELSIDAGAFAEIGGSDASTTGHIVGSLIGGTSYTFAVRAVGTSLTGAVAMVTATPLAVPAEPTMFAATPGVSQVTLSWGDPLNSSISSYELSIDAGAFAEIGGSDASTTGHIVDNLTNGTTYSFAVRAVNAFGDGAPVTATATPLFAAPKDLSATAGAGEVTLDWTDPGNNNISGYQLSIDSGSYAAIVGSNGTTTRHTVQDLINGTSYVFAVRAVNASSIGAGAMVTATPLAELVVSFGASNYEATEGGNDASVTVSLSALADRTLTIPITTEPTSGDFALSATSLSFAMGDQTMIITVSAGDDADLDDEQVVMGFGTMPDHIREGSPSTTTVELKDKGQEETTSPPPPPPVPGRPGNLTAAPDDRAAALSWTAAAHNGSPIIKYQHRRSDVGWEDVPGGPTATEVTVSGLTNGVEHVFYVRAVSSAGAGAEASVIATPAAVPDAPGNLTAAPDDGAVALTWTAAGNNGSPVTKYQHQRDDAPWADVAGGATANSLTIAGLVNGIRYTFSVRAVNGMGEGEVASVTAAPEPGPTVTLVPTPEPSPAPGPTTEPTAEPPPMATATPGPTQQPDVATPTPTAVPTQEPTAVPVPMATATPEPPRQVVLVPSTVGPTRAPVLTATVTPLPTMGKLVVTPTTAPMVGLTPLRTAIPMPGIGATVVPSAILEPTARPTATPAGTALKEAQSRIADSPLVPVGIGLFALLIAALAALFLASRRRRTQDRDEE